MATISSNASWSSSSVSISGTTAVTSTISWTVPTMPSGAVIESCVLTGTPTITMRKGTGNVTVNGTTVTSGSQFSIDLGTGNTTNSVQVSCKGNNKNASGTVTFSDLVYTVTYTESAANPTYTVTFVDWDGTVLETQQVEEGSSATAPDDPTREGYTFTGWDINFSNVTSDLTVTAQYEEDITEANIQSVSFDKENDTVEIPFDAASINYKLNYTWEPLNANKDFNITIYGLNANSIASYNEMTDEITFTGEGVITVTITSNQNSSISDSITIIVTREKEPEDDIIEWTGIGTVATDLKAHAGDDSYSHDNYKINLDWENESFDIIITGELNRSSNYFFNIGIIGDIKIGDIEFNILFSDGGISIYCDDTDSVLDYYNTDYGNFPFIISFTKKGIYVKSSANTGEYSTPELLSGSENIYEINQPIYFIDDGLIHSSVSNQENPEYNVIFDLAVSEFIVEEPEDPDLIEPVNGYIAKNLVSHGDWSYTFNVDWDTQYLDIEVLSYEYGLFGTFYYYDISNNSYDESYSHESLDDFIIHSVVVESDQNDIDIIRYSKVDGVCIITSNGTQIIPGNSFANDNKTTIKAVFPTEWLREGDGVMTFNIKITDITPSEEPEEDVIEWTGLGTVVTGLNSGIKHSNYKINLDWDNEYFDIILQNYTYTGNGVVAANVCNVQINNNTYEYYFSEGSIALRQGPINVYEWTPNVIPHTLRFAKDGIYCLYEEENVKIGEVEYNNDDVIYILEDDEYDTDFSMNFDLVVGELPNEEPEEPDNNELIQGGINNESGAFENEVPNIVKTNYIDISDKKQILVNVLTEDVYILKCYLYNANKELVKIIDISADKKRMFGLDLQKLIEEVMNDGNE